MNWALERAWYLLGRAGVGVKPPPCGRLVSAAVLAKELVRVRNQALDDAAAVAYSMPAYCHGFDPDELGRLKPGSPYDRGRYEAANAILALKEDE
jgi:hypothetical protein